MATTKIDATVLKNMFLAGAANLESKKEWINDLNVFPVPDGDTGTNMTLTIMSAAKEVIALEDVNMATLSKAISGGSLRGARGNSGVILSQLLRGFTKVARDYEELDAVVIATACQKAVETAYKAVMKPKEGTILTVARGMADKVLELSTDIEDIVELMDKVIVYGDEVLDNTPELLPVLKQAGVVDSGGQGLMQFMKGAYDALCGKEVSLDVIYGGEAKETKKESKYAYKLELSVVADKAVSADKTKDLTTQIEAIGDNVKVNVNGNSVYIVANTDHPGLVIEKAVVIGAIVETKVDYLKKDTIKVEEPVAAKEVTPEPKKDEPPKKYGFISVSAGEGLSEIFTSLSVDYIIEGGQTMNPSTEDMLNAIDQVNAENVFILPNNSNIILAANQAQSICDSKNIIVVPTKTIPQGISAMISFAEDASPEDNLSEMSEAATNIKSGSVTYAVRDTEIDNKTIKQGDYMGIGDKTILSVGKDLSEVTVSLVKELAADGAELISLYYGSDVTEEDANAVSEAIAEEYPDIDVEVNYGGQPIYYYLISVE